MYVNMYFILNKENDSWTAQVCKVVKLVFIGLEKDSQEFFRGLVFCMSFEVNEHEEKESSQ